VKLTEEQRLEQEVIESLGAPTQQDIITWAENAEKIRYEVAAAKAERRRKEAKEKFDRDLKMELAIASKPEKVAVEVPKAKPIKKAEPTRVYRHSLTTSIVLQPIKTMLGFIFIATLVLSFILGPEQGVHAMSDFGRVVVEMTTGGAHVFQEGFKASRAGG
jgi:hypothetical protein